MGEHDKVTEYFQNRVRASSPDEAALKIDARVEKMTGRQVEKVCRLRETHVDGWYQFMVKLLPK